MAVMRVGVESASVGQSAVLAGGAALYLAGNAAIRLHLRIRPAWLRLIAAALALVTIAVGAAAGLDVQLVVVAVVLVAPLLAEAALSREPTGQAEHHAGR
jgi:hypothetical protein